MKPEFSRTVRIDTIGSAPKDLTIEADTGEREALARRFGLLAIHRLAAEIRLVGSAEGVKADGRMTAEVDQPCVATGEAVPARLDETFEIMFRPQPADAAADEIELGAEEMDVVFYDGAMIDVGEAVAETLSLGLDPYPRSPAADVALSEAGVKNEEEAAVEASPFAALASLKGKLEG